MKKYFPKLIDEKKERCASIAYFAAQATVLFGLTAAIYLAGKNDAKPILPKITNASCNPTPR